MKNIIETKIVIEYKNISAKKVRKYKKSYKLGMKKYLNLKKININKTEEIENVI